MKFMSRKEHNVLAGLLLAAAAASPARADVLVLYDFNSITTPLAASTVGSGISASSIGIGVLSWTWTTPAGYLQEGPGAANTAAAAVATGNYFNFTLTSTAPMDLSSLTLDGAYGSYANPAGYVVESSVDAYSSMLSTAVFATAYPTFTTKTIDLSGASFQGLSSITFRVFGYCNNFSFLQFDNVTVNGTLAVPEPSALALAGIGMAGLFRLMASRRRN